MRGWEYSEQTNIKNNCTLSSGDVAGESSPPAGGPGGRGQVPRPLLHGAGTPADAGAVLRVPESQYPGFSPQARDPVHLKKYTNGEAKHSCYKFSLHFILLMPV
jgi:hypothetical protein